MTLFDKAICFAVEAHSGMQRRRESTPYILHPMEVAAIAGTITSDEEVLAAAVLHDTVEDTDVSLEDVRRAFGDRVAYLVSTETENKRPEIPASQSWKIRKTESLSELESSGDFGTKIIWLADKLSNMRSFYRGFSISGHKLWRSFNQSDPGEQAWYYRTLVSILARDMKNYDAWKELNALVDIVFKDVEPAEQTGGRL